ncbi:MAG TPA: hypothetical protein VD978_14075 [Azospirillum sp.]|nr:hypothetical protein [Azospirillum sp.]
MRGFARIQVSKGCARAQPFVFWRNARRRQTRLTGTFTIGAAAGAMIGGPVGAVVGAGVGAAGGAGAQKLEERRAKWSDAGLTGGTSNWTRVQLPL